ncbi:Lmo0850 family protein [Bacillus niameyensis]|nr:Lmo0850 family protein [Bacillus niameyensis]
MQRDHDQLQKVICSLLESGVKISKTKSRLELGKIIEDLEVIRKHPELHS